ncbi:TetR/AcrR family transcriptional regulator [Nonomuraea solani]|uniref:TetR/AcrR family transcriptional regulator n=1 Tax=Nonomuraea solani TaxID=1144553 RepID=UPI001358BFBD|nr:TetR family transcriptional regulator C-terminal domain-containing protein [Nonomuraea solani]
MPRRVDHDERRTGIARALWRVAEAKGLDRVSLREVAAEAGMSLGRLQHYFGTREDMMVFAVEFMNKRNVERVAERMLAMGGQDPLTRLRAIVMEMLPVDARAQAGSLINVSFLLEAARSEPLGEYARKRALALRGLLEGQIALAMRAGRLDPRLDPEAEAALLVGLADGLRAGFHLGALTAERTVELMEIHLARLNTPV